MASAYQILRPDPETGHRIRDYPRLPMRASFIKGSRIDDQLAVPLEFAGDFSDTKPAPHLLGTMIPVMSTALLAALAAQGVDNLQTFEAVLTNPKTGARLTGFRAVNIIGLIACADLAASEYEQIAARPGNAVPYLKFDRLVIDDAKAKGQPLFRLAHDPGIVLIHDRVANALRSSAPPGGWGINLTPVDEPA